MSAHMSLSVSVAVVGAIATYVWGQWDTYNVWIGFIAWAAFLANNNCMKTTVQSGVMGAVLAGIAFILMGSGIASGLGGASTAVIVGVTVFALVWLTSMPMFTSATTAVYTYAATVGYALGSNTGGMFQEMSMSNPLATVIVSIVGGCLFAMLANKVNETIS